MSGFVERKTRLELATPTLARLCTTNRAISAFCNPYLCFGIAKLGIFSDFPNFFEKIFKKSAFFYPNAPKTAT